MLARLFRRTHQPPLPATSAELAEALRTAAQFADSDAARLEYTNAADALDRAITFTRQHGDEPTRDALAYALGRAELNLKDQMAELIDVSKETHIIAQGLQAAQSEQGAAVVELRAEFHTFGEHVSDRIAGLEQRVTAHDQSRDRSIEDRRLLREDMTVSNAHRARMQLTLNQIDQRLAAIEALLEVAGERDDRREAGERDRANGGGDGC